MVHFNRLIVQLFAVVALLAGGAACAAPTYHVALDTSAYSGTGWLDLQFNPGMGALPASATVSNFSGLLASGLAPDLQGGVSGPFPGAVVFTNASGFNALFQAVVLGGAFSFDLRFSDDAAASIFALALYGDDQMTALGNGDAFTNSLVSFEGGPSVNDAAIVSVTEVTEVPEPAVLLLLLAGLAGVVAVRAGTPRLSSQRLCE